MIANFVQYLDLPIIKYTLYDGQILNFSSPSSIATLQKMDRQLLNEYDYIYCSPEQELLTIGIKVYLRLNMWALASFAPRVLLLRPNEHQS